MPKDLIDLFVRGPMSAEAVNAASMAFKKALIERALGAELTHPLGQRVRLIAGLRWLSRSQTRRSSRSQSDLERDAENQRICHRVGGRSDRIYR